MPEGAGGIIMSALEEVVKRREKARSKRGRIHATEKEEGEDLII
jgi:hypothetical protein